MALAVARLDLLGSPMLEFVYVVSIQFSLMEIATTAPLTTIQLPQQIVLLPLVHVLITFHSIPAGLSVIAIITPSSFKALVLIAPPQLLEE
jgi:hypothetical protein